MQARVLLVKANSNLGPECAPTINWLNLVFIGSNILDKVRPKIRWGWGGVGGGWRRGLVGKGRSFESERVFLKWIYLLQGLSSGPKPSWVEFHKHRFYWILHCETVKLNKWINSPWCQCSLWPVTFAPHRLFPFSSFSFSSSLLLFLPAHIFKQPVASGFQNCL